MATINERMAYCVALPSDVCPTSSIDSPRYLALVDDEHLGVHVLGLHVPYFHGWALLRYLCIERARNTVDGMLRVRGATCTPETYLARWRAAVESPIAIGDVPTLLGHTPVAVFQWQQTPSLAAKRPNWVEPPFPCFGALLEAHQSTLQSDVPGSGHLSRLEIDLSVPHGARDAWWADDFLGESTEAELVLCRRIEMRPADAMAHHRLINPTTDRTSSASVALF